MKNFIRAGLIGAALALSAVSATAQTANPYANVRGWAVSSYYNGANFVYCAADRQYGPYLYRVVWDGSAWTLWINYPYTAPPYTATLQIDGATYQVAGTSDNAWSYLVLPKPVFAGWKGGSLAYITLHDLYLTVQLTGTSASAASILDCYNYQGKPPNYAPPKPGYTPPKNTGGGYTPPKNNY